MATYVLKRRTYSEGESSSLGKKMLIGATAAAGGLYAAKTGMIGARTQMALNNRMGQLGGKMSQLGNKHNIGSLSKLGNKTMNSAAKDFNKGVVRAEMNKFTAKLPKGATLTEAQKKSAEAVGNRATGIRQGQWMTAGRTTT